MKELYRFRQFLAEGVIKEEQMGSYGKFLKVVKSYEDEEILSDFLDSYPKGQDISKSEYERFTEKHLGLSDPEDYRGENWKYIMSEGVTADEITSRVRKLGKEKGIEDKYIEDYIDELDGNFEPDAYENSTDKDLLDDLKSYIDLSEGVVKEDYDKESLLKALGDADDAFIQLSNGRELVIYNPNSNNDENADMWNNDVVYAVSKDGDEVEVLYSDIAGINLEKENMQDADLLAKLAIDILDEFRVYAESEDLIQYLNKSMDYLERIPSNDDVYSAIQAVADGLNLYTGEEFDYEVDDMQSELERLIA